MMRTLFLGASTPDRSDTAAFKLLTAISDAITRMIEEAAGMAAMGPFLKIVFIRARYETTAAVEYSKP